MIKGDTGEPPNIVVGVLAYNEENSIAKVIAKAKEFCNDVIVCDDGSTDLTGEIAEGLGCKVVAHPKNLGKNAALRSLFIAARKSRPDVFVTMAGKGKYNSQEILKLVTPILKGECDIAIGSRISDSPKEEPVSLNLSILTSAGMPVKDPESLFRAYSKNAIANIRPAADDSGSANKSILYLAMGEGLKIFEYPIAQVPEAMELPTPSPVSQLNASDSRNVLSRFLDWMIAKPMFSFGIPAMLFVILAAAQAGISGYEIVKHGVVPNFDIMFMFSLAIIAVLFSVTSVALYSVKTPRQPPK